MGFPRQEYWGGLPLPSPVDHILSELATMTHLSWVALHTWLIVSQKLSAKELMLLNCGVGEDSESPLDGKIKSLHPKGDQSWIFIGRTDAEAETPILWAPDAKNWLIGKDPDAGKDWRQEKGTTEDKKVEGWMALPTWWTWVWASSGIDRDVWRAAVHRVSKGQTQMSDWTELPALKTSNGLKMSSSWFYSTCSVKC